MKIIYDVPGQTCNRFWSYVNLISEAITNNKRVSILRFDRTINEFPNLIDSEFIKLPYYNKRLIDILGIDRYLFLLNKILFNRFTNPITLKYWKSKGSVVNGWDYRGHNIDLIKNKDEIVKIFSPKLSIVAKVDSFFQELRNKFDIIIGVHIRRGDYKEWLNGRYYYDLDEYYSFIRTVSEQEPNKKVCFFISSNENFDTTLFDEVESFKLKDGTAIEDLYALSCCDKIMGPLSTYSRWASFYGEVPYMVLEKGEQVFPNMFSKVISLYKCENGYEFTNWTSVEEDQKNDIVR